MNKIIAAGALAAALSLAAPGPGAAQQAPVTGYAAVNGLEMYYEIHGSGEPLVVLHGAFMSIPAMGPVVPELAKTRRVIAVEFMGHGRTADTGRPMTYEQLADDTAALMGAVGVERADIFGFSMGGGVALQLAIRHPALVRKLVVASASYHSGGYRPGILAGIGQITPEVFAGSPMEADFMRLAPDPAAWPALIDKLKVLDGTVQDWPTEAIAAIAAPTLVIVGDSDVITLEHAVSLFGLLGGDVAGDVVGLPQDRLAVLPGTAHLGVMGQGDLLLAVIRPFLDAPMPVAE